MLTNTDRDTHRLKPTHIEAILQRHLQCDIAICMISVHKRSTDWDSPLGYKQVISHYTRRISYECIGFRNVGFRKFRNVTYVHHYWISCMCMYIAICIIYFLALTYQLHQLYCARFLICIYVTVSAKTVLNGTFGITRKTDLKYSSCCGSVVLDFSHARFTV